MNTITLTYNVKFCILLLYLVLALITIAAYILGFMKKNVENFKTRMKSFWIIVILFTAAFMFNKLAAIIFIMLIINCLHIQERKFQD